jgi:phosphomannomutase
MKVDPSMFKAYDIRGIYEDNLFPETATAIGKAFVKLLAPKTVILGRDGRVSGPALYEAMVAGITSCGVDVIDIGMVSTDMYYYACAEKKLPGIMITASHNPKEYNGFKMVRQIPYLLSGEDGIQEIREYVENDNFPPVADQPGQVSSWDIMDGYIDKVISLIGDVTKIKPFTVAVDPANGMVGPSFAKLAERIPQLKVIPMYFDVDGNFPNHGGDPLLAENRVDLEKRVVTEHADFGFAFDPDGDRFFCVDGQGRFVSGDFLTALYAQYFLDKVPGTAIVYDIRASYAVPEIITAKGGKALYNKVGHAFIKRRMVDENAIFGGEVSGHYYFTDFYYCDAGLVAATYFLDMMSKASESLEKMVDRLSSKYYISGEINTKGVDGKVVFAKLEEKYGKDSLETLYVDGVSMKFPDWHFNVRTSNTEPLVRLNLEAVDRATMEAKRDEVLALIRS